MLKSLDILIGLAVVMLMVSLIVTVITGALNNLLQTRGKNLLAGIASLLHQIHPDMPLEVSNAISAAILTHPLIKSAGEKFGTVIHREELTALLLQLASGEGASKLEDSLRDHLLTLLRNNGIPDPAATLANVRAMALKLEQANPELSNHERMARAFLQEASSKFLGKINGWFDTTIDRVADRFTNSTRTVTFAASLAVALVMQLDTAKLVGRLNTDTALRQSLVQQAATIDGKTLSDLLPKDPNAAGSSQADAAKIEQSRLYLQSLSSVDVIDMPTSWSDWVGRWGDVGNATMKLLGILLTTMLLSLGAPFWYNALKNLLRLRSLIAQKDDDQRVARQSDTTGAAGTSSPATTTKSLVVVGERGDLASLG